MVLRVGKVGEEDVTGSIKIPEVAHDTEEDEYVVCIAMDCSFSE